MKYAIIWNIQLFIIPAIHYAPTVSILIAHHNYSYITNFMLKIARNLRWCLFKKLKSRQIVHLLPNTHFAINKLKFGFSFIKNKQM